MRVKLMAGAAAAWIVNGPALPAASIIASDSSSHSTSLTGSFGGADASKIHWPETRNTAAESRFSIMTSFSVLPQNLSAFEPSEAMKGPDTRWLSAEPFNLGADTSAVLPATDDISASIFRNSVGNDAIMDQSAGGGGMADARQAGHNSAALVIFQYPDEKTGKRPEGSAAYVVQSGETGTVEIEQGGMNPAAHLMQDGAENIAFVEQIGGNGNYANTVQTANKSKISIVQIGQDGGSYSNVRQTGYGSSFEIAQIGSGNAVGDVGAFAQLADQSVIRVAQQTTGNAINGTQSGVSNQLFIDQVVTQGAKAFVYQAGAHNRSDLEQAGSGAYAFVEQSGSYGNLRLRQAGENSAEILQAGYRNDVLVTQLGPGHDVLITQTGSRGLINISQLGSGGAYAEVRQAGGSDNQALVMQQSLGAFAVISQTGGGSYASIFQ